MKKFLNDPKQFVPEFLEGIQLASGGALKYEPKYNLIYRADMPNDNKVSIIQGSGSGHEPAHTMIVGPGMLAMRGRAAYTGERSIGSVDAGATALGVILQAISGAWRAEHGR